MRTKKTKVTTTWTTVADMPNKHTDRLAWERCWQADLERNYPDKPISTPAIYDGLPGALLDGRGLATADGLTYETWCRAVCANQEIIRSQIGADSYVLAAFEAKWRSLSSAEREKTVLEGVYETCCVPFLEAVRMVCPDSTVRHLCSRNGETYLDMLKAFVRSDRDGSRGEPFRLPYPTVDKFLDSSQGNGAARKSTTLAVVFKRGRINFMTELVWRIFLAFVICIESR